MEDDDDESVVLDGWIGAKAALEEMAMAETKAERANFIVVLLVVLLETGIGVLGDDGMPKKKIGVSCLLVLLSLFLFCCTDTTER